MHKLLVASTNPGKLKELREMMADVDVAWCMPQDVGLGGMDVEETGQTFFDNALLKARAYCQASGLPVIADDSGLAVDALNGGPGVHSARYAPTPEARIEKLLKAIDGVPHERRKAHFVSVIALVLPDGTTLSTEGRVDGWIATAPRGTQGFGYDPIFLVDDGRTMAELDPAEKNAISHRGRAFAKLHPLLRCLFAQE